MGLEGGFGGGCEYVLVNASRGDLQKCILLTFSPCTDSVSSRS